MRAPETFVLAPTGEIALRAVLLGASEAVLLVLASDRLALLLAIPVIVGLAGALLVQSRIVVLSTALAGFCVAITAATALQNQADGSVADRTQIGVPIGIALVLLGQYLAHRAFQARRGDHSTPKANS
jgi:hypothetical protein